MKLPKKFIPDVFAIGKAKADSAHVFASQLQCICRKKVALKIKHGKRFAQKLRSALDAGVDNTLHFGGYVEQLIYFRRGQRGRRRYAFE